MIFLIAKCDSPTYVGSNKYDYMQQRKYFPANKITSIEKSIANFKNKSLVTATMHEGWKKDDCDIKGQVPNEQFSIRVCNCFCSSYLLGECKF